ncbi:MAG TPA: hypothetical protein VJA66_07955 [Thermoanaerobaculia bacterium]
MTSKRRTTSVQRKEKNPKVKRETIKDLTVRIKAEKIKGGVKDPTLGCQR